MEQQLSTLNTTEPLDYDNLNIVTHPRPPRRRQSGASLVPFRPYVKSLTGVREPFGYADGFNPWKTTGQREIFFKQDNARCIGTLLDDCDVSDVIRWDIQGESTRLPMMCKLWIIVDGAVVERGKPHLVQDAAVQVFTAGRNRRSILAAEQRYGQSSMSSFDRRRRHSWHDVNEYHSVPYYQYTRSIRSGYQNDIQCDLDNEEETSQQEYLPHLLEEMVEEDQADQLEEHTALESVHNQSTLQDRAQISIMTQTEQEFEDRATEIQTDFLALFNLDIQTNESLLSPVVNQYRRSSVSNISWERRKSFRHGREYLDQCVATGDDYPLWWLQLSTNVLLSTQITNQSEEKKKISPSPIPSPRQQQQLDQSIQTDIEPDSDHDLDKTRPPSSTRSSRIQKSSSSITINDTYEIIDQTNDGNNSRRMLPFHDQHQRLDSDSHLSDYHTEGSSAREETRRHRRRTTSSKQSDSDYHTYASTINQQSYSTPEPPLQTQRTSIHSSTNEFTPRQRTKSSESSSNTALTILLERYERTLKERQQAIAIVNDQFLDIDDVLKRYRPRIENPDRAVQLHREISELSTQSREEMPLRPSSAASSLIVSRVTTNHKYRTMPEISSEEMLQGYVPSPRISLTMTSPRQRQPRFDYCDLCLTDSNTSSAWIRYNEQRIEQLQKRIDLLLQIDDHDESPLLFSTETVTQCIDEILMRKPRRRNSLMAYHTRILLPHRYNFRYPYRSNTTLPASPRLLTRKLIRSNHSTRKSVRISTIPDPIRLREPLKLITQPIVSILRRPANPPSITLRPQRVTETSHVWRDETEGKVYILKQFSIPRYYRLYNDVSFREMYNFSRMLDTYLTPTTSDKYSSIVKQYALQRQSPPITSVA